MAVKILSTTLEFLTGLKENNSREWFAANRKKYEHAKSNVEDFITGLIPEIAGIDPSVGMPELKDCIFRINRDIRFSPDKSPYKAHFGVFIAKGGRKSILPGYYVHIEPGASMLAGGIYMPQPEILKLIRQEIYFNAGEFLKILSAPEFVANFGEIDPFDKLKKPPKDFPADFPFIDLLKYRSYTVIHGVGDKTVCSESFGQKCVEVFKVMGPFHSFLRRAIEQG